MASSQSDDVDLSAPPPDLRGRLQPRPAAYRPATGRKLVPPSQWEVLIKDHMPSYISWDRYEANLQQLARNSARAAAMGAPRDGSSLLAGLVVCGRMMVAYPGQSTRPRYSCQRATIDYAEPACQSLAGSGLDNLVARQVLTALEPASLELSLGAGDDLRREREKIDLHWRQRLERARYEADRAARQYHATEPENRLVARELEKRWEQVLVAAREIEQEYDHFQRQQSVGLTTAERDMILSLARDIPALFRASTTTASDRRMIVRHLVERVEVAVQGETERVDVAISWAGGFMSRHELRRPVRRVEQLQDFALLMSRVRELQGIGKTSSEIAERLNIEGFRPAKRRETFNAGMVRQLLSRQSRTGPRPKALTDESPLREHEWWLTDLARELGMPQPTVHSWLRRGWIGARKLPGHHGR